MFVVVCGNSSCSSSGWKAVGVDSEGAVPSGICRVYFCLGIKDFFYPFLQPESVDF